MDKMRADAEQELSDGLDTQASEALRITEVYEQNDADEKIHEESESSEASQYSQSVIDTDQSSATDTMLEMAFDKYAGVSQLSRLKSVAETAVQKYNRTSGHFGDEQSQPEIERSKSFTSKHRKIMVKTFTDIDREMRYNSIRNPLIVIMEQIEEAIGNDGLPEGIADALIVCQEVKDQIYNKHIEKIREDTKRFYFQNNQIGRQTFKSYLSGTLEKRKSTVSSAADFAASMSNMPRHSESMSSIDSSDMQIQESQIEFKIQEARKYESMLNSCMIQEISSDERYAAIEKMEAMCIAKSDTLFHDHFDKNRIQEMLHEAEQMESKEEGFTLEVFITKFASLVDGVFIDEFINKPLMELFGSKIEEVPDFLSSHFKNKIWQRLTDMIEAFQSSFVSTIEENWVNFIIEERKQLQFFEDKQAFKSQDLESNILVAAFSIITILPLRSEIKLGTDFVVDKVQLSRELLEIMSKPYPTWNYEKSEMDRRVNRLKTLLANYCQEDYILIVQTIHRLMFTLLNTFINTKQYDSKDRHLLKLFIETITPALRDLMLLNDSVNLHYFLTIFESQFGERIPKDVYDLKLMSKLFGKELLEELKINQSMTRCQVLELARVTQNPNMKSRHCVICVSGFLQEKIDKKEEWQPLLSYYKNSEVYALTWTSCNTSDFFNKGIFYKVKNQEDGTQKVKQLSLLKKVQNVTSVFLTANRQYINAYDQARLSGSLLAIFLLKSNFSNGRAVNIIGYSLGAVVIMNCIRVLKQMYRKGFDKAGKILHDVHLWGGAYVVDPNKTLNERMRCAFHCAVVNGMLVNVWTQKDSVLKLLQPRMQPGTVAMGVKEIMLDVPEDDDGSIGCKKIRNHDVTKWSPDHHGFLKGCNQFMPLTPLNF